ncbi:MAG: aspartate aminotransferase family protein [Kiritimatiellae bacterium]|nr:aspartate aminotransferase family protein [Kiritimatiellia bacterium]MDW8457976.1 aspartate aminotransferase family protein [Verrucomicrobiota bacterium]
MDPVALHKQYIVNTYSPNLVLTRGSGCRVWDAEGREYLDFLGGIAVIQVGHCHPRLVEAIQRQAARLMHVSNLYYNENAPRLAAKLVEKFGAPGRVFFCNSGAEANEGLIKLARLWGSASGRHEIITMRNSFHGRTLAAITATGQTKYQKGFEPLPPGFVYAEYNNLASVRSAVNEKTVAILVEAVQGEGGIVPATAEFMQGLRALCDEFNLLLFCDEVQCGMGRTGHWFGFQAYGVQADGCSLAKGLGGGLPIGAFIAGPKVAEVFQPGHHASTFGGNPVACAAALAVIQIIEDERLLENAAQLGEFMMRELRALAAQFPWMRDVRGKGLMIGLVLDHPAKAFEKALLANGLITIATAEHVIRMLPPLNITRDDALAALRIIAETARNYSP